MRLMANRLILHSTLPLCSIDTDAVHLDLFGPMKPGILRAAEGENFLYLIMPVRV